jgi:hypothetical protein
MSQKVTQWGKSGPEKMPGWFSWRHQTNTEHVVARENYLHEHGKVARRRRALERASR